MGDAPDLQQQQEQQQQEQQQQCITSVTERPQSALHAVILTTEVQVQHVYAGFIAVRREVKPEQRVWSRKADMTAAS
jgi:hypothetical protein